MTQNIQLKKTWWGPLLCTRSIRYSYKYPIHESTRYTYKYLIHEQVLDTRTSTRHLHKYSKHAQVPNTDTSTRRRRKSVTATNSRFLQPNTTEHVAENLNEKKNTKHWLLLYRKTTARRWRQVAVARQRAGDSD